jgi:hypothetical protein
MILLFPLVQNDNKRDTIWCKFETVLACTPVVVLLGEVTISRIFLPLYKTVQSDRLHSTFRLL